MDAQNVKNANEDEEYYDKDQAREKKIILGNDVKDYKAKMERIYPGCIIYMVDMATQE